MIINTNFEALRTSNILNASNRSLGESLARLSSGSKIVNPSDDAAGIAVSSRLKAQVSRVNTALSNIGNSISFTQTQDGFLKTAANTLQRMGELAMLSQDVTKGAADRNLYGAEYDTLKLHLDSIASKEFNGIGLFDNANAYAMVSDEDGETFNAAALAFTTNVITPLAANDITTSAALAKTAVGTIKTAITSLATLRASVGATQSRLNYSREQLEITKENLSSSISRITDVNMAEESTNYSKYQILVNSGTAMLTQANTLPQAALRLIQ